MSIAITKVEAELVLDCLDFDILLVTKDFKILFANKSFLNRLALQKNEVFGHYCYKISHHSDDPCTPPTDPCPILEVIETGKAAVEMHTHFNKENKEVFVNVTAAPLQSGKEACFLHITLPAREGIDKEENMKQALEKTMDVLGVVALYQQQMTEIRKKTEVLEATKRELEEKVQALENFNKVAVGRELKMVELKAEIKELEGRLLD